MSCFLIVLTTDVSMLQLAIMERVVSSVERWATLQRSAPMMERTKRKALLRNLSIQSRTLVGNEEMQTKGRKLLGVMTVCLNDRLKYKMDKISLTLPFS